MELMDKAGIIVEFVQEFALEEEFEEFFNYNDLGIPISICYANNLIEFKNDGADLINETYKELCDLFDADENEEYENLEDLIG